MANTKGILERLQKGPILCAEGYLFELERRGYVKAGPFIPEVVLEHPDAVLRLHRDFLYAGSDVMVAFTYYGHREKLRSAGKLDLLERLNREALRLARKAADEGDALVAGNLSNTWLYDPDDEQGSRDKIMPIFDEQCAWAKEEGADFIIAETFSHLGEARLALEAGKSAGFPVMIGFIPTCELSLDGYSWADACEAIEKEGADITGLNCGRGPATMNSYLKEIRERLDGHMAALPVPYRTNEEHPYFQDLRLENGERAFPCALDPFQHTRYEMAEFADFAREIGIDFIGICCGAGPHHVRSMAEALGKKPVSGRYSPDLTVHPVLSKGGIYCPGDMTD